MWNFLLYIIPWYVQVSIVAGMAAVLFLLAVRVFGWERVRLLFIPAITILAALGLLSRSRQAGWKDKIEADVRAAEKLGDRATTARAEADKRNSDPERLRDDDGFRRD